MEIEVTQADRDAANLAFNVWDNTNELALAFARHRQAAIKERDAEIVAWLRVRGEDYRMAGQGGYATVLDLAADAIERGEV